MNMHKSYYAHTSRRYRLLTYVIIPFGLLILHSISLLRWNEDITVATTSLLTGWFILSDSWAFGGCCSGQAAGMNLLKSSPQGMKFLRNTLIWDCLMRFAAMTLTLLLFVLVGAFDCFAGSEVVWTGGLIKEWLIPQILSQILAWFPEILTGILIAYAVSTLGVLICRYTALTAWNILAAYLGMLLTIILPALTGLTAASSLPLAVPLVGAAAASVVFSVLTVKNIMKNMRNGYYDKEAKR